MKAKNLLLLGAGLVVLYVVCNKYLNPESKASASGRNSRKDCTCNVTFGGVTQTIPCKCRKCDDCQGAINIETAS